MFNESNGAVMFSVKVVPRASKNQIAGVEGDAIKVRLNAPPVEGKTNDMLIAFLADALGVRRAQVEIVTGHSSRHKVVRVRGVSVQEVERKLMQK
jgi:uncharacterized protein (TIGR00251 family)